MTICPIITEQQNKKIREIKQLLDQVRVLMGNQSPCNKSTSNQLQDLVFVANQVGLYDASDIIQGLIRS